MPQKPALPAIVQDIQMPEAENAVQTIKADTAQILQYLEQSPVERGLPIPDVNEEAEREPMPQMYSLMRRGCMC